jgi:uncharacterized damage-inducible protein DinB
MMPKIQQDELTALFLKRWEEVSGKVAELAAEIPASEFESRPLAGIRTCGEVLRHIAFWNRYVADSLTGRNADGEANELALAAYPTKTSILEALKSSSGSAGSALRERQAPLDLEAAGLLMSFLEHTSEHYGQLVIYARFLSIVPPSSRA